MEPCPSVSSVGASPCTMPHCKVVRAGRGSSSSSSSSSRHHPYKHHRGAGVACTRAPPLRLDDGGPPPSSHPHGRHLATPALVGGKYLLLGQVEGSALYRCVHVRTRKEYVAKVLGVDAGRTMLRAHMRMEGHPHVSPLCEVVWAASKVCLLLPPAPFGDLHSHVRTRRRLRESEARRLFRQMAAAVSDCHRRGLVLRDLKLRKFVFTDAYRTQLRLESLEDAVVVGDEGAAFDDASSSAPFADYSPAFPSSYAAAVAGSGSQWEQDDRLEEKRGCPAYVSPEILRSGEKYSGRAADMWSLGVVLYTMLVGRYPFNDSEHASLFAKISRGRFGLPDAVSPRARCLVRSLLRREPSERLTAPDVLLHPWLAPCLAGRARDEDWDAEDAEEGGGPGGEGGKARAGRSPRARHPQPPAHGDQAVPESSCDSSSLPCPP